MVECCCDLACTLCDVFWKTQCVMMFLCTVLEHLSGRSALRLVSIVQQVPWQQMPCTAVATCAIHQAVAQAVLHDIVLCLLPDSVS